MSEPFVLMLAMLLMVAVIVCFVVGICATVLTLWQLCNRRVLWRSGRLLIMAWLLVFCAIWLFIDGSQIILANTFVSHDDVTAISLGVLTSGCMSFVRARRVYDNEMRTPARNTR